MCVKIMDIRLTALANKCLEWGMPSTMPELITNHDVMPVLQANVPMQMF